MWAVIRTESTRLVGREEMMSSSLHLGQEMVTAVVSILTEMSGMASRGCNCSVDTATPAMVMVWENPPGKMVEVVRVTGPDFPGP